MTYHGPMILVNPTHLAEARRYAEIVRQIGAEHLSESDWLTVVRAAEKIMKLLPEEEQTDGR